MDELEELRKDFADEAIEICKRTEELILSSEITTGFNSTVELVRKEMLGSLHTIKGNSGFIGLDLLKEFTHALESILKANTQFPLSSAVKSSFLDVLDCIQNYCLNLSTTDIFPTDRGDKIKKNLEQLLTAVQNSTLDNSVSPEPEKEDLKQYQADFDKVTVQYDDLDLLLNLTGDIC